MWKMFSYNCVCNGFSNHMQLCGNFIFFAFHSFWHPRHHVNKDHDTAEKLHEQHAAQGFDILTNGFFVLQIWI